MPVGSEVNVETPCVGRFGYVSAYDGERHRARVRFPDKDNLVSAWLPVGVENSKKNKDKNPLDVGEQVYCNMLGNGLEMGVILCSIYSDKNKPPEGNSDVRKTIFGDGTEISYDREEHKLTVKLTPGGKVRMEAPEGVIEIEADSVTSGGEGGSSRMSVDGRRNVYAKKQSVTRAGEEVQIGTPDEENEIPATPRVKIQSQNGTRLESGGPVEVDAPDIVLRGTVWGDVRPLGDYPGNG